MIFRMFKELRVHRTNPHPIQLDGEMVEAGCDIRQIAIAIGIGIAIELVRS